MRTQISRARLRRKAVAIAGCALFTALTGACDGGDGSQSGAPPSAPTTGAVQAEGLLAPPGTQWLVRPEDIVPGAGIAMNQATEEPGVHVLAEAVVVVLGTDKGRQLVGLDPAGGSVMWSSAGTTGDCWTVSDDTMLLCTDGGGTALRRIDPATGEPTAVHEAPAEDLVASDRWVYAAREVPGLTDGRHDIELVRLDVDDLRPSWTAEGKDPQPGLDGKRDYFPGVRTRLLDDRVEVTNGELSWMFDAKTGEPVDPPQLGTVVDDGYRLKSDYETERMLVTDAAGREVAAGTGEAWNTPDGDLIVDHRVGLGPGLHDLATGRVVWERPDLYVVADAGYVLSAPWTWTPDRRQVLADDFQNLPSDPHGTSVLDAATGVTLWHSDARIDRYNAEFLGQAVVTTGSGNAVTVLDRSTGDVAWRRNLRRLFEFFDEDYSTSLNRLGVSETAIVGYTFNTIVGFSSFGAAPEAPQDPPSPRRSRPVPPSGAPSP